MAETTPPRTTPIKSQPSIQLDFAIKVKALLSPRAILSLSLPHVSASYTYAAYSRMQRDMRERALISRAEKKEEEKMRAAAAAARTQKGEK